MSSLSGASLAVKHLSAGEQQSHWCGYPGPLGHLLDQTHKCLCVNKLAESIWAWAEGHQCPHTGVYLQLNVSKVGLALTHVAMDKVDKVGQVFLELAAEATPVVQLEV